MDQVNLGAWIDRGTSQDGGVSASMAQQAQTVLGGREDAPLRSGDQLPALWHWFGFPPRAHMDELGPDGHPRMSGYMPPLGLKRRMWAGGTLEFLRPLHVGEALTRQTRIANIQTKSGGAGEIVVVDLDHEIFGEDGLAVMERQSLVYLEIPKRYQPPKAKPAPSRPDICEDVAVSTPLLMRYSAITFNAHRIHYDLPYTQQVEHYPDLVVHGPLQANLLMDRAVHHRGMTPRLFSYRGVHPLFAGDALQVQAEKTSDAEWTLCTVANGTHRCMQAAAVWEV